MEKIQRGVESEKVFNEFLSAMANSRSKRKIWIRFRLKGGEKEYKTWLTYKQYLIFKKIDCIDYCDTINLV